MCCSLSTSYILTSVTSFNYILSYCIFDYIPLCIYSLYCNEKYIQFQLPFKWWVASCCSCRAIANGSCWVVAWCGAASPSLLLVQGEEVLHVGVAVVGSPLTSPSMATTEPPLGYHNRCAHAAH